MMKLCVNIDPIAFLKHHRQDSSLSLLDLVHHILDAGANYISVRMHKQLREHDVFQLKPLSSKLILEGTPSPDYLDFVKKIKPLLCCFIPPFFSSSDKVDLYEQFNYLTTPVEHVKQEGILSAIVIDPNKQQAELSKQAQADYIYIQTGHYASVGKLAKEQALLHIAQTSSFASTLGLKSMAGRKLTYHNVSDLCKIPKIDSVVMGESILSKAFLVGLKPAIQEMKHMLAQPPF